jgi:hypothetical protein
MEILSVEQLRLAVGEPPRAGKRLTFRAVTIATGVVGDALVATAVALLDMAAQGRRATRLDRGHGPPLRGGEGRAVLSTVDIAVATEHVRHFGGVARHRPERQAGAATTPVASRDDGGKISRGLAVAHTVLVARRRYRAVVLRLRCPSSSWIVRRSVPDSSR